MAHIDELINDHPEMFRGIYRIGEFRREPVRPKLTFQVESIEATRHEAMPLLDRHYDEIAQFKDVQKLDPDWETYEALELKGRLWVMTARSDGKLIGYIVMIMSRDLHYRNVMKAAEDIHFILPEYRKGLLGYRLIAKAKQAMKDKGMQMVSFRTKAGHDHGVLFERLGGVLHDLVYTIVL